MNPKLLRLLAALLSALTLAGGLDLAGVLPLLPAGWAAVLATVPPALLALGSFILVLGDVLDDGQKNNSFPGSVNLAPWTFLLGLALTAAALALNSCAGLSLGYQGRYGSATATPDGGFALAGRPPVTPAK